MLKMSDKRDNQNSPLDYRMKGRCHPEVTPGQSQTSQKAGHITLLGNQYGFLQHARALQCTLLAVVITEQVQRRHAVTCP